MAASDSLRAAENAPGCAGWKFRISTMRWEEYAPILRPTELRAETDFSTEYEQNNLKNIVSGISQAGQPGPSGFLAYGGKTRRSPGGNQPSHRKRRRIARSPF